MDDAASTSELYFDWNYEAWNKYIKAIYGQGSWTVTLDFFRMPEEKEPEVFEIKRLY